jgi:hypothetical protein
MIKQKTINLIKKYYFVVFTIIINFFLLFGFYVLYNKLDNLSDTSNKIPPPNLVSETKSIFSGLYSNLEDYLATINNIKIQEEKNKVEVENYKQKKSDEYLDLYSKDQEEFFKNFQNITGIGRYYNE